MPRAEIEPRILYHKSFRISTEKIKKKKKLSKNQTDPLLTFGTGPNFLRKKRKEGQIFSRKALTIHVAYVIIAFVNGVSPSGKATDSDSVIT